MKTKITNTAVLTKAQDFVQSRGYHGFSFEDLADSLSVSVDDIREHFPTKPDLGVALMKVYDDGLSEVLAQFDVKDISNRERLIEYIDLYRQKERHSAICACGSLASDYVTLPDKLKTSITDYFERTENWIADTLQNGLKSQEFTLIGSEAEAATDLLSALQGGLILARARSGASVIDSLESVFLARLTKP